MDVSESGRSLESARLLLEEVDADALVGNLEVVCVGTDKAKNEFEAAEVK